MSASASRACASADSAVTVMKAFNLEFSRSIRSRHACVSSTGETFLLRTSSEASLRLSRVTLKFCALFWAAICASARSPIPPIKVTAVADKAFLTKFLREQFVPSPLDIRRDYSLGLEFIPNGVRDPYQ